MGNGMDGNDGLIAGYSGNGRERSMDAESVEDIIKILDDYVMSGSSRMKLKVVEGTGEVISKEYHHGRWDVGSPWARGQAFDVLEDE